MRVIVVKRGSHDFGWLVVVDRCIRTATLRSWKAGAFVRLDLGFRPNPAKQALSRTVYLIRFAVQRGKPGGGSSRWGRLSIARACVPDVEWQVVSPSSWPGLAPCASG